MKYTYKEITIPKLTEALNNNGSVSIELTFSQSKTCIAFFKVVDDESHISRLYMIYMIVKTALTGIFSPKLINVISFYVLEHPSYVVSKENRKSILIFTNQELR